MSKSCPDNPTASPVRPILGLASLLMAGVVATTYAPTPAQAVEHELTLGLGPTYTDLPTRGSEGQQGIGAGLYGEYRFNNFWGLTFGGMGSYQLSVAEDDLGGIRILSGWAGVIYNLDVATYVPFATLSLTAYNADPALEDDEGNPVDAGVKFGLGVDYRRYRRWSFGVEANLHAFLTDPSNYPVYFTTLLRINYHYALY
ncbi:MAG: outer membrane beta-barrel protein [Myxococcota bacterium]